MRDIPAPHREFACKQKRPRPVTRMYLNHIETLPRVKGYNMYEPIHFYF
jgi:hypothetical protein